MIAEPTTTLTDYALAVQSLWLGTRLLSATSLSPHENRGGEGPGAGQARRFWGGALLATAVAAAVGGTSHGFAPLLDARGFDSLRFLAYLAVGIANLLALWGCGFAFLPRGPRRVFLLAMLIKTVVYAAWLTQHLDFRYVVYDYGASLMLMAVLAVTGRRRPGAGALLAGVLVGCVGALAQRSGFVLHPHFNHNDLFHVVEMAGVGLYYRAAAALQDQ